MKFCSQDTTLFLTQLKGCLSLSPWLLPPPLLLGCLGDLGVLQLLSHPATSAHVMSASLKALRTPGFQNCITRPAV